MSSSPAPSGTVSPGLDALLHHAAFAPIQNDGWIRVAGSDRVRWLNGMVTNNIAGLKPGEGCYNFFLNAQGRIQGDATTFLLEHGLALETGRDRVPALMAMLDHFIIMDDVELADASSDGAGILIAGPQAAEILRTIGIPPETSGSIALHTLTFQSQELWLIHAESSLSPRFELWCETNQIAAIIDALIAAGAIAATPNDLEHLRILSGTPLFGTDIRDKDLPQETNQTRALHFSKGCYLGQEIVERIRSRGAVHRTFTGFVLEGDIAPAGTPLTVDEKSVGELTSVARIGERILALGYIRREALDRNASIQYAGGIATPSALPFPLVPSPETSPAHVR